MTPRTSTNSRSGVARRVLELGRGKYDGNPHTTAMHGKIHTRQEWVDAMMTHTGCVVGPRPWT